MGKGKPEAAAMFMSRQNRELQEKIGRYLEVAGHTFDCLQTGMRHYVKHGLDAHFDGGGQCAERRADPYLDERLLGPGRAGGAELSHR